MTRSTRCTQFVIVMSLLLSLFVQSPLRAQTPAVDEVPQARLQRADSATKPVLDDPAPRRLEPKQELEVARGHSTLFQTSEALTRISFADPEVIDVVHYNSNQIGVIGLKAGSTTLTVWFGDSKPHEHVVRVNGNTMSLAKQLAAHESAEAAEAAEAAVIRQLQANGQADKNKQPIAEHQRKLKNLLSTAFDLKLQLEELQVKELQSRLSRLERQIVQRRELREKIINRRAAELIEGDALKWSSTGSVVVKEVESGTPLFGVRDPEEMKPSNARSNLPSSGSEAGSSNGATLFDSIKGESPGGITTPRR